MSTQRRFTADFKTKVALEALRGDKTIQEIALKQTIHANQMSKWKRQAAAGLGEVFANGPGKAGADDETEILDRHAKICQLTVERDFFCGWVGPPGT